MKAKATIDAGACGYKTNVVADFDEKSGDCALFIKTDCPHFAKVAAVLHHVKPSDEFVWETSQVHNAMHANCSHTACPVPSGIVKAVQVACGKKPPVNASIVVEKLPDVS
jgi:hypothetical protein